MADLVDRYVHQVGRYLPPKDRADIEAELRSQIQDQLDDRYPETPAPADVAAVLLELGDPRRMAASYSGERYLVGPALYPTMMMVLRHGWLLIPAIVIFLSFFGLLAEPDARPLVDQVLETLWSVVQSTLIFSAVVVLIFALVERSGTAFEEWPPFNPLELPAVDDPRSVDRVESAFGIALGTGVALVLLYFLRVGGLTLHFNLNDPGEVIPVPTLWLVLLIASVFAMLILHLWVLRRNRWGRWSWLIETVLEVVGAICLYFMLFVPIFERLAVTIPALADLTSLPEIITILSALGTLVGRLPRLLRLWSYNGGDTNRFTTQADG